MWLKMAPLVPIAVWTRSSASSRRANEESTITRALKCFRGACSYQTANARNNRKSRADLESGNQSPGSSGDASEDLGFVYKNDPDMMNGYTPPINPDTLLPLSPSLGSMDYEQEAHVPHMICTCSSIARHPP